MTRKESITLAALGVVLTAHVGPMHAVAAIGLGDLIVLACWALERAFTRRLPRLP